MTNEIGVGAVYRDVDRGRLVRVLFIATPDAHKVKKPVAACYASGKLTAIAVERLLNPTRYERVPQEN